MSCAMKLTELLYCTMASIAEIAMNTTISRRMKRTCFDSLMFLIKLSFIRSIVIVELETMTRDERVDMDAESTRMTIRAIIPSERPESIVGMMES